MACAHVFIVTTYGQFVHASFCIECMIILCGQLSSLFSFLNLLLCLTFDANGCSIFRCVFCPENRSMLLVQGDGVQDVIPKRLLAKTRKLIKEGEHVLS